MNAIRKKLSLVRANLASFFVGVFLLATLVAPVSGQSRGGTNAVADQLTAIDFDYKEKLEDLLRTAIQQDDQILVSALRARLAVVAKGGAKPIMTKGRTLRVVATIVSAGELYTSKNGIQWKDSLNGPVTDITVNGVQWVPVFGGGAYGRFGSETLLPMNVGTIVNWKATGKVAAKKIERGPGVTSFLIEKKDEKALRETFTLEIEYQPAPTGH